MKNLLKRNKKNIFNGSFLIILFMITLYYVFHGSGDSLSEVWAKIADGRSGMGCTVCDF